jgi:hypothetical protein
MNLTEHFTLEELIRSDYATRKYIDNRPDADILENLKILAQGLERIRRILCVPLIISSGYRCPKLNTAIGGSRSSAHMQGLAADFTAPAYGDPTEVVAALIERKSDINYDQVILEFPDRGGWVHVGFADSPRGQALVYDGRNYSRLPIA